MAKVELSIGGRLVSAGATGWKVYDIGSSLYNNEPVNGGDVADLLLFSGATYSTFQSPHLTDRISVLDDASNARGVQGTVSLSSKVGVPRRGVTLGGKYDVGEYASLRGRVAEPGLDAHHVGQQALMRRYVSGYDPQAAPSILVPKVGHTIRGPQGIVSRSTSGISSTRQAVARDIFELRRVYSDVPNSQLKTLIEMNKQMYPTVGVKP